jgi:hypothetical protein
MQDFILEKKEIFEKNYKKETTEKLSPENIEKYKKMLNN